MSITRQNDPNRPVLINLALIFCPEYTLVG